MSSLRGQIQELCYAIASDIEHGECFYDQGMFIEFCENLDKMKELSCQYYNENLDEIE